jgi:hypothetical protein
MSAFKNDYNFEPIPDSWLNEAAGLLAHSVDLDLSSGSLDISATDDHKNRVLRLTGTLTTNRTVTLPADDGRGWLVVNATSGAFTATVKTSGGAGVVVTQGKSALVRCDGTDILPAGNDFASLQGVSAITDANGNELLKFTAVASAVNELTVTNAATGSGPLLEGTGGDTNIDVTVRGKGSGGVQVSRSGGKLAFFGATLAARAAAITQTYATADRTLSAYTSDPESVAYTGQDNAQAGTVYAKLTDLQALRVAYDNLRVFAEDVAQLLNAVVDDLQAYGLEQ